MFDIQVYIKCCVRFGLKFAKEIPGQKVSRSFSGYAILRMAISSDYAPNLSYALWEMLL